MNKKTQPQPVIWGEKDERREKRMKGEFKAKKRVSLSDTLF
ncbi:MAG: hypothetical protein JWO09_838 [Bacteroidetes bacterium]|nr:hypothetical protein [Bacteroidota bacterium]